MRTESDVRQVIQRFYDALRRGAVPEVLALLHTELSWTEAERFPYYSGTWRSPQEVLEKLLIPLASDWENFSATPHEFITEGNKVVSLGHYAGTNRATGRTMIAPFAHYWTVREDRITRFEMYVDTAKVLEAMRI